MKQLKLFFLLLPWILLLLALLFWALGFEIPGSQSKREEFISTQVLKKVEDIGKLELIKHQYKEILDYKSLSGSKIAAETTLRTYDYDPDLKAVILASGEAVGCIDLKKMTRDDIRVAADTLYIYLPSPELCYYKLDMEKTSVYHFERTGWWSKFFTDDAEVKSVIEKGYREAERQIKNAALSSNILEQTQQNATLVLGPLFEEMSGKKVKFIFTLPQQSIDLE